MSNEEMVTTTDDGVWKMDVDTFQPTPAGHIKIGSVEFPIFTFLDIPIEDSLKVVRFSEEIDAADSYEGKLERSIQQIMLLNKPGTPQLTREHFAAVRPRQILMLTVLAGSLAKVPLKPTGSPASGDNLVSPLPASDVSSAGPEKVSSV